MSITISNPTTNGRCGPQYGNQKCINNACCSIHGWCGGDQTAKDKGVWCTSAHGFSGKYDAPTPTLTESSNPIQTLTPNPTPNPSKPPSQLNQLDYQQLDQLQSNTVYIISSLSSCCLFFLILIILYFLL